MKLKRRDKICKQQQIITEVLCDVVHLILNNSNYP